MHIRMARHSAALEWDGIGRKERPRFYRMFLCQNSWTCRLRPSMKLAFLPWWLFVQQHESLLHNLGQKNDWKTWDNSPHLKSCCFPSAEWRFGQIWKLWAPHQDTSVCGRSEMTGYINHSEIFKGWPKLFRFSSQRKRQQYLGCLGDACCLW